MSALLSERNLILVLALLALLSAPVIYRVVRRRPPLRAVIDGFVLVAVGGLLAIHLIPESVEAGGLWAIGGLMLGLGVPVFLELGGGALARRVHLVTLLLALSGLAVHAALDGVALSLVGLGGATTALGIAVVLHRVPTALLVWSRAEPTWGPGRAFGLLTLLVVATIVGFVAGAAAQRVLSSGGVAVFQAVVAGSLAHVLVHRPERHHRERHIGERAGELVGALLGLLTLMMVDGGDHGGHHFLERFEGLALQIAPALGIGLVAAAVVGVTLAPALARRKPPAGSLGGAAYGVLFGLSMPVCSCASDRIYGGLQRRGEGPASAMAYFVATPALALEAIVMSAWLLGGLVTLVWAAGAAGIAIVAGWWLARSASVAEPPQPRASLAEARTGTRGRVGDAARIAFVELVDVVGPWIVVGVVVAAAVEPGLLSGLLDALPPGADLVIFAALGIPGSIGAAGAVVFALALVVAGASPGAGVAFVLSGPIANLSGLRQLAAQHGWPFTRRFAALVVGSAVGLGALTNALGVEISGSFGFVPPVETSIGYVALVAVGLALLGSVARRGPSAFVRAVLSLGEHEHHHDHEHAHRADHGDAEDDPHGSGSSRRTHEHAHRKAAARSAGHHHDRLGLSFEEPEEPDEHRRSDALEHQERGRPGGSERPSG